MPLPITSGGSANAPGPGGGPSGSGLSQGLSAGWTQCYDDATGLEIKRSFAGSASVKFRALATADISSVVFAFGVGIWTLSTALYSTTACDPPGQPPGSGEDRTYRITAAGLGLTTTVVESVTTGCFQGTPPVINSGTHAFSITAGPFRLGMRHNGPAVATAPTFAQQNQLEYAWFADANTIFSVTFAGLSTGTWYWIGPSLTQPAPQTVAASPGVLSWTFNTPSTGGATRIIELTGLTVDSDLIVTAALNTSVQKGGSAGAIDGYNAGNEGQTAGTPYRVTYDVDPRKNGSASVTTGATVDLVWPFAASYTAPVSRSDSHTPRSWVTAPSSYVVSAALNAAWALAQSPSYRSDDLAIVLDCARARHSPSSPSDGWYQPVTVAIAAVQNVQRPDGATPSNWVTSDAAKLTVAEGATDTTLTVTATGAHVLRTLVHNWRTWMSTPAQRLRYVTTKRNQHGATGEDCWGWNVYRWLKLSLTAPAAGTLTLTVPGVHLEVDDPHTTGSNRTDNLVSTEDPYTYTYSVPVSAGTASYWVDLSFPVTGGPGPVELSRIDSLKLEGFSVGTWVITGLTVETREQGYCKVDFGPPVDRQDYSAIGLAQDGGSVLGEWGDQAYKPDEIGQYGGNARYVDPITGYPSGLVQDTQYSLQGFWEQLKEIEGISVTWDAAAADAANKDSYGVSLGAGIAQWTRPHELTPFARFVAGSLQARCSPRVGSIKLCPGPVFGIFSRDNKGHAAVETLAVQDGVRAEAAQSVTLEAVVGGADVGTASTDASGYAIVSPVPANGSVAYQWALPATGGSIVLSPHDLRRLTATLESGAYGVDLLQTQQGWLFRASALTGSVTVARSTDQAQTWTSVTVASGAAALAAPTLCRDQHDNLYCWWHTAADAATCYLSEDYGATWSLYATVAGLKFPRMALETGQGLAGIVVGWASGLAVYTTTDAGASATLSTTLADAAEGLAALRVDRHGVAHLVYKDTTGQIVHRYRVPETGAWSAVTVLAAAGTHPSFDAGLDRGFVTYWTSASALAGKWVTESNTAAGAAFTPPAGLWKRGNLGVLIDRYHVWWHSGRQVSGGTLAERYSEDDAATFQTP